MPQASFNMGVLQLATTSLSVLASHSTHRQTQSGRFVCKFSDLLMFWISWKKCIIWTNYFFYFSFHLRRHYQNENFHFSLGLERGGFSPGDTTSLLLMWPRHNTLYYTPITGQYNSPRIYCLLCTLVWQVLIRTECSFRRDLRNSSFIFFRCDFTSLLNKIPSFSLKFLLLNENKFENVSGLIHIY